MGKRWKWSQWAEQSQCLRGTNSNLGGASGNHPVGGRAEHRTGGRSLVLSARGPHHAEEQCPALLAPPRPGA